MKCCCDNIFNLGCLTQCDSLFLNFDTPAGVAYSVEITQNGISNTLNLISDENGLLIPSDNFTEYGNILISVFDSQGSQINFEIDGEVYDCINLQTKVNINAQHRVVELSCKVEAEDIAQLSADEFDTGDVPVWDGTKFVPLKGTILME